jgi:hypothetical protein
MVLGAIFSDGSRALVWIDGNIDSKKYCDILKENLFENYDLSNMFLQHDNAPSHRSKYT